MFHCRWFCSIFGAELGQFGAFLASAQVLADLNSVFTIATGGAGILSGGYLLKQCCKDMSWKQLGGIALSVLAAAAGVASLLTGVGAIYYGLAFALSVIASAPSIVTHWSHMSSHHRIGLIIAVALMAFGIAAVLTGFGALAGGAAFSAGVAAITATIEASKAATAVAMLSSVAVGEFSRRLIYSNVNYFDETDKSLLVNRPCDTCDSVDDKISTVPESRGRRGSCSSALSDRTAQAEANDHAITAIENGLFRTTKPR